VTILTALTSLLTGVRVRGDTAMTGEATLRGLVLPVGGIKEKVLAAHRAGIKRVILPERCRKDLQDVPDQAKKDIEFIFATRMDEVLDAALEKSPFKTPVAPPEGGEKTEAQVPPQPEPTPEVRA
jgi:ATP-dependent Lon protease